jgi:hypothetical protein
MEAPGTTDRSRARLRQELKRLGGRGDGIADQQRDDRATAIPRGPISAVIPTMKAPVANSERAIAEAIAK